MQKIKFNLSLIVITCFLGLQPSCGWLKKSSSNRLNFVPGESSEHPAPNSLLTGAVPASVSSSELGYAGSAIPIDTLPVGNQFAPKLALSYSSSMTEVGLGGVGWNLSAGSVIIRCASQKFFDGISKPIDWTNSDSWCIDGKKLLLVAGKAGVEGAEYRTFLDDKTKIIFTSGHFEAWQKSGEHLIFGESDAAREPGLNGAFLSFHLNRMLDRAGNAVDYFYLKDGGHLFLDQIRYGGNVAFQRPHYRTIAFQYETPSISVTKFVAGQKYEADRLLKSITVASGEAVSWTYRLHHERKTPASLPVLTAVDQCFKDLSCFPKTTFEYDAPENISVSEIPGFAWPQFGTQTSLTWASDKSARAFADLNSDGYTDILGIRKDEINFSLSGPDGPGPVVTQKRTDFTNWSPLLDMFALADMNRDGFMDIIFFTDFGAKAGTSIAFGNGHGFDDFKFLTTAFGKNWKVKFHIRSVIDVDGDGWPDVIGNNDQGIFVAYNDHQGGLVGGTQPVAPYFVGGGWQFKDSPRFFMDVNGDGLVDIIGLGKEAVLVSLGTGRGFKDPQIWSTYFITPTFPAITDYRYLADMNGDGLPDIVGFGERGVDVGLNTGKGFTDPIRWLDKLSYRKDWNKFRKERFVLDVNRDGFPDLIGFREDGVEIYLNQGVPNPSQVGIKAPALSRKGLNSWNDEVEPLQLDDLNADGKMDMFILLKEGVWRSQFEAKPIRLISVKTALGEETRIVYKSLLDPSVYKITAANTPEKTILSGPLEVVSEIKKSNGLGGFFSTRYSYENGAYNNQAFGFLGYEKRHIFDESAGTESIETYGQDAASLKLGTPIGSEIYFVRGGRRTLFSQSSSEIESLPLGTHPLHRALLEKSSLSRFYDEAGLELYSVTVQKDYDDFLNVSLVTTTLKDARGSHTTTGETRFRNDPEHWVIGLPETVTTTSANTSAAERLVKTSIFEYDSAGLMTSETMEPDSPLWVKKEYGRTKNQYGLVDTVVTSWGAASAKGLDFTTISTSQEFDARGFAAATINALGHRKSQSIDADTGIVLKTMDENGLETTITYDAANRPIASIYPDGRRVDIERLMCDASCPQGAVLYQREVSNRDGSRTSYLDSLGRSVRVVGSLIGEQKVAKDSVYNELGLLVRESKPYFLGDGPSQWISYGYDDRNRQNLVTLPDGSRTQMIYEGLKQTRIDALGRKTVSEKDSRGLLQSITNPKGEVLGYAYDAAGQLRKLMDAGGNITKMGYDLYGRRIRLDDPSTGVTTSEYNALGKAAEEQRQGRKTLSTYDALGRLKSMERSVPGTPVIRESYVYDSASHGIGQLAEAFGPDHSIRIVYDNLSRPFENTETILARSFVRRSTYDALGRVQTQTSPGGVTVGYDYDAAGQVKTIRDQRTGKNLWNLEALYPNGDLKAYTLGNGSRGMLQEDVRTDRLIAETVMAPDQTLQMARSYLHDPVGNLKTRTDGLTGKTENFTYDALDRLESFAGKEFKAVTMRYDQLSRITERSDVGAYAYGAGCQGAFDSPFAPKKVGSRSFCTDIRGNMISAGARTLTYDANNMPVEMREGNLFVRYQYGLGKSVLTKDESIDGERTLTRQVGSDFEIVESNGSTKERTYISDFLVIETEGSEYRENYLYQDYLGSTLASADQNGAILERMDYDPFGQRRRLDDLSWLDAGSFHPKATSRGFTGHDQIESMNLIHMKGRVYDPTIGLFLTPDTFVQDLTLTQNLNRYSYVVNNPLRYNDPSGHFFTDHFFHEIGRGLKSAGDALRNPGRFMDSTWRKLLQGASDPRYLRLAASVAISVFATIHCPFGADAAWYQTAAYYAAVGATSSYVASNGDTKAALNGAVTGAAFNMVGSFFEYAAKAETLTANTLIVAKIAGHGVVGGLSSRSQGGSFESGFLSAGLSQAAGQFGVYESLGASDQAEGFGIAYNAAVAAVVGGAISSATGGSFEQGALNAAMGRLFNDMSHVLKLGPSLVGMAAADGPLPIGEVAAAGVAVAAYVYGDEVVDWAGNKISALFSDGPKEGSAGGEGAGKAFSDKTKDKARAESDDECVFCGIGTTAQPGPTKSEIDHAIPKSRGGNNTLDNAQNTCRTCNRQKGAKTTQEFLDSL